MCIRDRIYDILIIVFVCEELRSVSRYRRGREMHERYIEQIVSAYNHIDSIIITDDQGYITYYLTYRYDVNHSSAASVMGKHVLSVWPTLSEKTCFPITLAALILFTSYLYRCV